MIYGPLDAERNVSRDRQLLRWRAYYLLEPWGFEFENDWRIEAAYIGGIKPGRGKKVCDIFGHHTKIRPPRKMLTPADFRKIGEAHLKEAKRNK